MISQVCIDDSLRAQHAEVAKLLLKPFVYLIFRPMEA
jgi:hypothetical protein